MQQAVKGLRLSDTTPRSQKPSSLSLDANFIFSHKTRSQWDYIYVHFIAVYTRRITK
jgi:hypothetical protein